MARKKRRGGENKGLVFGLIMFFMMTVAASVLAYVQFEQVDEAKQLKKAAEEAKEEALTLLETARADNEEFRKMILPSPTNDEKADLVAQKSTIKGILDKPRVPAEIMDAKDPKDQVFPTLTSYVKFLENELEASHNEKNTAVALNDQLQKERSAEITAANTEATNAKQKLTQEQSRVQTKIDEYKESMDLKDTQLADLRQQLLDARNEFTQKGREKETLITKLQSDLKNAKAIKQAIDEAEIKEKQAKFDKPDGSIIATLDGGREVEINLGARDNLLPGITFSVYPTSLDGNVLKEPIAKIETVEVYPSTALCKVTDYNIRKPILRNYVIFNPSWTPGQQMHVAFVGLIKLDRDDRADNEQFRRMLERAGAKVDAYMTIKDGEPEMVGKINLKTDWLVVGDIPEPGKSVYTQELTKLSQKIATEVANQSTAASTLGVPRVDMSKFINYMGRNRGIATVPGGEENDIMYPKSNFRPE